MKSQAVLIGLPSAGLELLASQLDVSRREVPEIRHECENSPGEESKTLSVERISSKLSDCIDVTNRGAILLVYTSPAEFLARWLKRALDAKLAPEDLGPLAREALEFWRAYHNAMLEQYREHEEGSLLLNGDHAIDIEALLVRMKERFGARSVPRRTARSMPDETSIDARRVSMFQIIDVFSPECLELYAELESCAELMGREPEFEFTGPAARQAQACELLQLSARQKQLEHALAQARVRSEEDAARVRSLGEENEKLLNQLRDIQQELDRHRLLQQKAEEEMAAMRTKETEEHADREAETSSLRNENELLLHEVHQIREQLEGNLSSHRKSEEEWERSRNEQARLIADREAEIARITKEHDQAQALSQELSRTLATAGKEVKALRGKNELLLLQLHQLQEDLQNDFSLRERGLGLGSASAKEGPNKNGIDLQNDDFYERVSLLRSAGSLLGIGGKRAKALRQHARLIGQSGYFDAGWYLEQYPEVAQTGLDPAEHYLKIGASEGKNPGPKFDTCWYLERYPDVVAAKMNPLLHYIKHGIDEGRQPMRFQV
jgi:hypothetical protein